MMKSQTGVQRKRRFRLTDDDLWGYAFILVSMIAFGVFTLYRTTALLAFAISLLFALSFPFAKRVLHLHRPDNTQPPRKSIPNA